MAADIEYPKEYYTASYIRYYLSERLGEHRFRFDHPILGYVSQHSARCRFKISCDSRRMFNDRNAFKTNSVTINVQGDLVEIAFIEGYYYQKYDLADPECFDKIKDFILGSLEDITA